MDQIIVLSHVPELIQCYIGRAGMFADLLEVELQKMEVNEDLAPSPTSTKL